MSDDKQLVLDLPTRAALGRDDYFVAPCNAMALRVLEGWRDWPGGKLALCGPRASGKTHLAHVWAQQVGAGIVAAADLRGVPLALTPMVVEDVDRIGGNRDAQTALFHLYNNAHAAGHALLVTGQDAPTRWPIELPDLASRLGSLMVTMLEMPDDTLLAAMLVKLFHDRQLSVGPALISYLTPRMGRTYGDVVDLVARLDHAGLSRKKPLTVRLAASVLNKEQP